MARVNQDLHIFARYAYFLCYSYQNAFNAVTRDKTRLLTSLPPTITLCRMVNIETRQCLFVHTYINY